MPYGLKTPDDHSEFGGGPGLIDPVLRKDRLLTNEQQLMEIYATETAPSGANLEAVGAGDLRGVAREAALAAERARLEKLAVPETAEIERP
jgi:hypothetical protein